MAGLRKMFGPQVMQKGSNITPERLRLDFNVDHKMTQEEIKQLEDFVNDAISKAIPVTYEELSIDDAKKVALLVFLKINMAKLLRFTLLVM